AELGGGGQPFPDVRGNGAATQDGIAEVAPQDVPDVDRVLNEHGLVEAEVVHEDLLIALTRVDVEQEVHRVTREPGEHENDADHDQHAQHRLQYSPDQEAPHAIGRPGSRTPSCGNPCDRESTASPRPSARAPRWNGPTRSRRPARTRGARDPAPP